jgi:uncharacterized membrane protein
MKPALTWPRRVFVALAGNPLATLALGYFWWRDRPDSLPGQIVSGLVMVGAIVVGDALGDYWRHNPYAERLKARTAGDRPVSSARMGYLLGSLLFVFVVGALVLGAAHVLGPHLPSFVRQ